MSVYIINKHVLFQNVMIMSVFGEYLTGQEGTTLESIEIEMWTRLPMPILKMMMLI
jgi:hypothetical protein